MRPSKPFVSPLFFLIVMVSCFVVIPLRSRADTCPAGTTPITDATRAAATSVGIPANVSCWNPNDPYIGQQAGGAKQWLAQHATTNSNITCLNTDFAEKLQKLMSAVPGGAPTITDGYRSPQAQANLPAGSTQAGPCQSYHQYGEAADFNNSSQQTLLWMRRNAAQYGLAPVSPCAIETGRTCNGGLVDPGHIQIAGPRTGQCGVCSNAGGNGTIPAAPTVTPGPDDVPGGALSCPNGYALFNNQCVLTQQNRLCPQGYLMINDQCAPFNQNQNIMPPPVTNNQPMAPLSTSGLTPAANTAPQGSTAISTSSDTTSSGSTTNATSTDTSGHFSDQMNSLLDRASISTSNDSSHIIGLILNTVSPNPKQTRKDSGAALNPGTAVSINVEGIPRTAASDLSPTTSAVTNDLATDQTFTSNGSSDSNYSLTEQTTLGSRILADLRNVLTSILTYLHILQGPMY